MIRGTTPSHVFKLPFPTDRIAKAKIMYAQDDKVLVIKTLNDCSLDGDTLTVKLSQEDTLKFDCKKLLEIQVRALTHAGEVVATRPKKISVLKCFDEEVMEL